MNQRIWVSIVGVSVVLAYSALMVTQALVLDPLAAVPGHTLAQIHSHLTQDGMDVRTDISSVLISGAVGVLLAVGVAVIGLWRKLPTTVIVALFLGLIALGALATFGNGFALGMDVADSYGTSGADHTVWAGVLYATSLLALGGVAAVVTRTAVLSRKSAPVATP